MGRLLRSDPTDDDLARDYRLIATPEPGLRGGLPSQANKLAPRCSAPSLGPYTPTATLRTRMPQLRTRDSLASSFTDNCFARLPALPLKLHDRFANYALLLGRVSLSIHRNSGWDFVFVTSVISADRAWCFKP